MADEKEILDEQENKEQETQKKEAAAEKNIESEAGEPEKTEEEKLKEQLAGIAPPEKLTKTQRKLWDYMRLHPEVTEFSTIAKRTGLARNTVKKHYGMMKETLEREDEKRL